MNSRERFLTAMQNGIPDRVPVTPDISNYIPCKRTGLPFWDIYFHHKISLREAYLDAADYFGIDSWMASCTGPPFKYAKSPVEREVEIVHDRDQDAMIQKTVLHTPDGDLTSRSLCFRADPPSLIEKPIKDLASDLARYKHCQSEPVELDCEAMNEMRGACEQRQQAFGLSIGYPGFQSWMYEVEGGVEPLVFAEMDTPEILEEWHDLDLARGTKAMKLLIEAKPDYILLGGSGTLTLSSPKLARKYAMPAITKWSAMAKKADTPTMIHCCGRERELVNMLCEETDVNCVNPLEIPPMGDVDLAEVKRTRGGQISLMGNLHTIEIMLRGTPDDVRSAAIQAMRDAGEGGGFILSTGDQCGRETPDENLFALVETAKEFGVYDQKTGKLPACSL